MHRKLLLIIELLLILSGSVSAGTYFVSNNGPYYNIQSAIDDAAIDYAASPLEPYWIFVKPGTYSGTGNRDIDFKGYPFTLSSMIDPCSPDWNVIEDTIIDCGGTETNPHRAFHFNTGESNDTIVRGLTIINGFTVGDNQPGPTGVGRRGDDPTLYPDLFQGPPVDPTIEIPADPNEEPPGEICFIYANSGEHAVGDGYGGAILCGDYTGGHPAAFVGGSGASPTIEYCIFQDNTVAGARGGDGADGLWGPWENANCVLEEPVIFDDGQWAGHGGHGDGYGYGGAIACLGGSSPKVRNCRFENNIAKGGLGGDGGTGGTSTDEGNTGVQGRGGHPGDAGAIPDPMAVPGYGDFGVLGVGSEGYGGAICGDGNTSGFGTSNPYIEGCTFDGNEARNGDAGEAGGRGLGDAIDFTDIVYATPERPGAVFISFLDGLMKGGAIITDDGTNVQIHDSTFTGNEAYYVVNELDFVVISFFEEELVYEGPDILYYTEGAALWSEDHASVTIDDCVFDKNQAGAVRLGSGGNVSVTNSSFTDNKAPNDDGGALKILSGNSPVTIANTAFNNNSSGYDGGAVFLRSTATITNCSFSENKADMFGGYVGDGGGIFAYNAGSNISLTMDSCGFAGNFAAWGGGLFFQDCGASTFTNCHFTNNIAKSGGGMYLLDGSTSVVEMKGGSIRGNRGTESWGIGGGVACQNSSFELYNCSVQDNSVEGANSSGGGICFYDGSADPKMHKLWNCLMTGNSAAGNGGAVSCEIFTGPALQSCTLSGNSAGGSGGGIFVDWSSTYLGGSGAKITNCIFENCDNHAIYEGGSASDVTLDTCDFYNNPDGDYYDFQTAQTVPGTSVGSSNYDYDPLFLPGPLDDYYLDSSSPLIDLGGVDASEICADYPSDCLSDYTVLVDGTPDSGLVDLGYHRDIVTDPNYTLTVTVIAGNGRVEIEPLPEPVSGKYYAGTIVKLTAIPSRNYRVKRWGGGTLFDNSPSPVSYVIMSSDRDVTVEFEPTTILYVGDDADYPTISSAISAAGEGDMIVVPTGIWQEPISNIAGGILIDKGVIISSENPDDPDTVANTIIDGLRGTNDWVRLGFTFDFNVTGAILDGFTIRNCGGRVGYSEDGDRSEDHPNGYDGGWNFGGAIEIRQGADPVIRNCIITDNVAHAGDGGNGVGADADNNAGRGGWGGMALGGAVYCDAGSSPTFENCEITNSSVKGGDGGNGGDEAVPGGLPNYGGNYSIAGDYYIHSTGLMIEFIEGDLWEVFESDYGTGYEGDYRWYSGYGGGVYCDEGSAVTFTDCIISGNRAFGGMSGTGGLFVVNDRPLEPLIEYVLPSYGGGVYIAADSTVTFTRCEIADNLAERVGVDFIDEGILLDTSTLPVAYRLDPYLGHGGGIAVEDNATVVFEDCQISNNEAAVGGGIYWTDDTVMTISDCNVVDNIAYHGAGLHTVKGEDTTSTIIRSLIAGNDATVQPQAFPDPDGSDPPVEPEVVLGRGAGLYSASANINIVDSVFAENEVSASGGGIYFSDTNTEATVASALVHNCLFVNNIAGADGGGITANLFAEPVIQNCTIANNLVNGFFEEGEFGTPDYIEYVFESSSGGGINAAGASDVLVTDSIVWGNYADDGSQIALTPGLYFAEATVTNSDVQGGQAQVYTGGEPDNLTWGAGNMSAEPAFVAGPISNYYLSHLEAGQPSNSPCIDAGGKNADEVCFNAVCLDQYTTRIDNVNDVNTVDMGYHYPGHEVAEPPVIEYYNLTVEVIGGNGHFTIVTPSGTTVDSTSVAYDYVKGTEVIITAKPDSGYRVEGWTEDGIESPVVETWYLVVMDFDGKKIQLRFEPNATITVPGDYTSIQTAIEAARAGDIVKISQGVFHNATGIIVDKPITITGSNPDDPGVVANTIIDGTGYPTQGFIFTENAGPGTVLNGITIANMGYGIPDPEDADDPGEDGFDGQFAVGGGILCLPGSSPTIKNCIIRDCSISAQNGSAGSQGDATILYNGRGGWGGGAYGAGIYIVGRELFDLEGIILPPGIVTNPTFINCTIMNNSVTGGNGGNGAGYVELDDPPVYIIPGYGGLFTNPELPNGSWEEMGMINDYRFYSGYGGGVFCGIGTSPTFEHCLITGNSTHGGMSGIGGENVAGVRQEPVYNYEIPTYGGGVYCSAGSDVTFTDCVITNNTSPKYTLYGPGDTIAEEATEPYNEVGEPRYHLNPYLGHGGGIAVENTASVELNRCYIRGNEASLGGGIFWAFDPESTQTGMVRIIDCNVVDNLAYLGAGMFGKNGSAMVNSSVVSDNFGGPTLDDVDDLGGQGGGIHIDSTSVDIINSRIINNTTNLSGGGVFLTGQSQDETTVRNCLIVGNEAGRDGGGISVNWYSSPFIENCTIADNIASGTFGGNSYGGGLSTAYNSDAVVTNSIFWNNSGQFGKQIVVATDFEFDLRPSTLELSYSDVQDGWAGLYVGTGCTLTFGPPDPNNFYETNIDDDPCFVADPCFVNNFYLSQPPNQIGTSPCVDTGSTGAGSICFEGPYGGTICLDDYTTSTDNDPDTGRVDMGYHHPLPVSPYKIQLDSCGLCDFPETRDGVIDILDLKTMAEWWLDMTCSVSPFCDGADVTGNGEVNYEDFGLFSYCWLEEDPNKPTPNPSAWAQGGEPKGSGQTAIAMTAETATDNWLFVEYNFICQGGGCNSSGWQSDPCYLDTGLTPGQYCTYYVITHDGAGNETAPSEPRSAFVGDDTDPPLPDPSEWLVVPGSDPVTPTTIDMAAEIADDPLPFNSDPVQYFFECTSDPDYDSPWQLSNVYSRDDYLGGTTYSFRVRTRDSSMNQNMTDWSPIAFVTAGIGRDDLPPDPDPMTWANPPQNIQNPPLSGQYYIQMIAATAVDPAPAGYDGGYDVEYSFECLQDGSKNSGWIDTEYYAVSVDDGADNYDFRVKARDTSPSYNETIWSCYCYSGDLPSACGCLGGGG